jgi:rhodanese-related sulfurtransferase
MLIVFSVLLLVAAVAATYFYARHQRAVSETAAYSISAEQLRSILDSSSPVYVLDVRHPLDLLADPHIIPGSVRIAPKDVIANPDLVPYDRDVVFYCTCPSDDTARESLHKARATNHQRVKFLRGGLAAWKSLGAPVETYDTAFHLDTL